MKSKPFLIIGLLGVVLVGGCIFDNHEAEAENRRIAFDRCMSDGRLYWDSEKQECFERPIEYGTCKFIDRRGEIARLPEFIRLNNTQTYLEMDCNQTLDFFSFECACLEFRPYTIVEDVTYWECERGFTIGRHPGYGYEYVHYLGKDETTEKYAGSGLLLVPYNGCEIAYYEVRVLHECRDETIELCWDDTND